MPFDVTVERYAECVRFRVSGATSFERFAQLIEVMADELEQYEDDRVLVDLRAVKGRLSTKEQQLIGELAAERFPPLFKLASLVPEGEITRNSERAAVVKGLRISVFDSEFGALAWLMEGKAN